MVESVPNNKKYHELVELLYHVMKYIIALTALTCFISVSNNPTSFLFSTTILLGLIYLYIIIVSYVKKET